GRLWNRGRGLGERRVERGATRVKTVVAAVLRLNSVVTQCGSIKECRLVFSEALGIESVASRVENLAVVGETHAPGGAGSLSLLGIGGARCARSVSDVAAQEKQ